MKRFFVSMVAVGFVGAAAFGQTNLNLCVVEQGNSCPGAGAANEITLPPDCDFEIAVIGELDNDTLNEGLALFGLDLSFAGGPLDPTAMTVPTSANVEAFNYPMGINNPSPASDASVICPPNCGFSGTLDAGTLRQIGGGQNTINNDIGNAPFPLGTVMTGVAWPGSAEVLVTGTVHIPAGLADGSYVLSIVAPFANVIQNDEDGGPPQNFHKTEAAGIDPVNNVINLTVVVDSAAGCGLPNLASTIPLDQGVLFRSENNIIRLNFDGNVAAGVGVVDLTGQIEINKILGCGSFGPDLASNFSFTVENDGGGSPTVVVLQETTVGGVLEHLSWYTVRNINFTAAAGFAPEFKVLVGDVTGDGRLLSADVTLINDATNCVIVGTCDPSLDINGDGRILSADVILANDGGQVVQVPHPCP